MYVYVWYCTCTSRVYLCLYTWDPIIVKYRGIVVNRCTKGSWTGVTKVAEIAVEWILLGIGGWVCVGHSDSRLVGRNDW